ncbi:HIT family protein [Brucella intermedia]|jgi:diadenosine tetraphosphate (Ap4A) HIT family hydrolase|uniref:HIT family protein n=1 Tax=Brucella intermedia TaxID=94625 RepID=UPI00224ACECD|nr:HIT family protein [Brucella intermedia]
MISPFHEPARWVEENEFAFAIRDGFPVSEGHTLVVPKRAVTTTTELSEDEFVACFRLIEAVKRDLSERYGAKGFNVGVNEGKAAGQTIDQLHFHVIPRYPGDMDDPVGGIRNIFPGKGEYRTKR